MHIKQITISNFRSFKQQPEIQPFSPGTNCVVGRNGSGKSNLFDAVQFALLAPRFYTLRPEERQALLHEGSGSTAVNAFVEIVFDNSDNRFSLENSDEVVLRRTVGQKKDEFFLQRKRANKNEIMSLLEGAGFSKSNPYYIVQQGKVSALCTMNDAQRLKLLKEVAGTTVYDEKKAESLAKMEDNQASIDKISEILKTIESRLTELHGEKEELTQYQTLDRERRAMEYTVYDKELRKARETLDIVEQERATTTEQLSEQHEAAREIHDRIRGCEATLKGKQQNLKRNRVNLVNLERDSTNALTHRTQLELECKELQESVKTGEEIEKVNSEELRTLTEEIDKAEKELRGTVGPDFDNANEVLRRLTHELDEANKKVEGLYAKQGRGRQFSSREERDVYLQESVGDLETAKTDKEAQLHEQQDRLSNLRRQIATETKGIEQNRSEIQKLSDTLESLNKTIDEKKRARLKVYEERKDQQRKTEELHSRVKECRDALHQASSDVRKVTPRATSMGLAALDRLVAEERLVVGEQYFGVLMDNFDLTDGRFATAVEVAAQNSLFHVVVDTDSTAAKLMRRLEAEKLGRVTFLPLNRLRVDSVNYPDTPDCKPLLSQCIRHDARVDAAMRHVFGKKLLARNMEAAAKWSKRSQMDAITGDGDLVSRKGALTGGFHDENRSRLRAHNSLNSARASLEAAEAEYREATRKAHAFDRSSTGLLSELQRLEARRGDFNHRLAELEGDIEGAASRVEDSRRVVESVEKTAIPVLQHNVSSLEGEIGRLREEIGTEITSGLSDDEKQLLTQLKSVQVELTSELQSQTDVVSELTVSRQRLESLLKDNLLRRRKELLEESVDEENDVGRRMSRGKASSADMLEQKKEDLEQRQRELDEAVRTAEEIESRLAEARSVDESLKSEVAKVRNEFDALKTEDAEKRKEIEQLEDQDEKLLNKRSMTRSKREEYMRKIQELGSLPPHSQLATFADTSINALMRALDRVNKKLKKYSHVNKKAYDQYVNFSEQRESLLKRKDELDEGAEKVQELIESLDRQKDEAINRTFRGVSAHFKDVFKELVPNGGGELIMRTALDESSAKTDDEESTEGAGGPSIDPDNPDVSLYRGVGIKVRFSAVGENYMMSQLSGGQKALVAMALIFAIQRCDPAPFYLFDELDQALDSTYRQAVANLIKGQAQSVDNPTQFIVSTFRPELVAISDRCYGISHQNKVSSLHHLSKKDALHFIANLQVEEEAVGDVTTLKSSAAGRGRKRKAASDAVEEDDEEDEAGEELGSDEGESS